VLVIAFASPIVELFVGNPTDPTVAVAVPLVYVGATTSLGMWGRYLSYAATTVVPAAINYYRFSTGKWKVISREYRPETSVGD
jgi:hypothetical protein